VWLVWCFVFVIFVAIVLVVGASGGGVSMAGMGYFLGGVV